MPEPLFSIDRVDAWHGKVPVLRGLSLAVPERAVVALLGPNGAGKTTTLRAVTGLHREKRGSIRFAGRAIQDLAPDEIVRLGISMVPERREVFTEMTVLENLELGAYTRRDRAAIRRDVERVLALFPALAERPRTAAGSLSGGQQQMLAIGRALMASPRLLLLDEPSLGLAPVLVSEIFRTIRDISATGTSILVVEQNALMALRIAHSGYVIENGRIVVHDTAPRLLEDPRVRRAYLGQPAR
jgi:branched-chain amino acid transport system ATP-binding protein